MAIKGLTDRDSITPRFPRIGKLHKGGEKSATGFGPDLDHWRFTSDRPEAEAAFVAAYGECPAQINVYLPHTSVEDNFQTWKEEWKSGGLGHRCNGETCTIWMGDDGKYHRNPKPCPGGCKEVGRLEVVIPEMLQAGHIGTVTMETHSLNDLISISETLLKTAELRGDNPLGLQGILFSLRRVPEEISVPGFGKNAGKRQRVEKWLVKIEPAVDWVQTQMALARTDTPALTMDDSDEGDYDTPVVTEIPSDPESADAQEPAGAMYPEAVSEEPPARDLWDAEENRSFAASTVKVLTAKNGKPYLLFCGDNIAAGWFGGRDKLLLAAPWIGSQVTKDQLGEVGAEIPLAIGVIFEASGQCLNAVSFYRV
jgi:hypothetical protein